MGDVQSISAIPHIPHDVIHAILEYLRNDYASLAACALSSHSFCPLSQKFLYRNITLNLSSESVCISRVCTLHAILTGNPLLGECVRHLCVLSPSKGTKDSQSLTTLRMFPHLRKLTIMGSSASARWTAIPRRLRSELYRLMESPTVVDMRLFLFKAFPMPHLTRCAQLKRLYIESIKPITKTGYHPTLTASPAQVGTLESLTMSCSYGVEPFFNALLLSRPWLKNLQTIHLGTLNLSEMPACQHILDLCANTLTSVTFLFLGSDSPVYYFPDLRLLRALRLLQVNFLQFDSSTTAWLQQFCETYISSVNRIEKIIIRALYGCDYISSDVWKLFDKTLAGITCLAKAHISISLAPGFTRTASVPPLMDENIPLLTKRGNTSVRVEHISIHNQRG